MRHHVGAYNLIVRKVSREPYVCTYMPSVDASVASPSAVFTVSLFFQMHTYTPAFTHLAGVPLLSVLAQASSAVMHPLTLFARVFLLIMHAYTDSATLATSSSTHTMLTYTHTTAWNTCTWTPTEREIRMVSGFKKVEVSGCNRRNYRSDKYSVDSTSHECIYYHVPLHLEHTPNLLY